MLSAAKRTNRIVNVEKRSHRFLDTAIMKKSQRLEPVVKVAESREQQAARALGQAQTLQNQAEQRLAELKNYKEEYLRRFHTQGSRGMSAAQMEDYRRFLGKLDLAIAQQQQVAEQTARIVEAKRGHWHERHGKTRALDKVVERYQADEQRREDRKEQHEQQNQYRVSSDE